MNLIFLLALFCLATSAFFSAAEIILVTVNRFKLQHLKEEGDSRATQIMTLLEEPEVVLSGILVGNNLSNVTCTALATLLCNQALSSTPFFGQHIPFLASVLVAPLILFGSEILPKNIGRRYSNELIFLVYRPISFCIRLMRPLLLGIHRGTAVVSKAMGVEPCSEYLKVSREEFVLWMKKSVDSGSVQQETEKMIQSTIDFRQTLVKEVMVPLTEMRAISLEKTRVYHLLDFARRHFFTRYPVYRDRIDQVVGYVNVLDVLAHKASDRQTIEEFMLPIDYVPNTLPVGKLFFRMQKNRVKMVVAVDEYGGCDGIVTSEDIMEELVGELAEEHEKFKPLITEVGKGEYLIDASIDIDDLNNELKLKLPKKSYETLAGFLITQMEKIPNVGDGSYINEFYFEVLEMENLAITQVKMKISEPMA
jgi:putative hemolysin